MNNLNVINNEWKNVNVATNKNTDKIETINLVDKDFNLSNNLKENGKDIC